MRSHLKSLVLSLCCSCLLTVPFLEANAVVLREQETAAVFERTLSDRARFEKLGRAQGLRGEHLAVYVDAIEAMSRDKPLLDYMARQLHQLGLTSVGEGRLPREQSEEIATTVMLVRNALATKGVRRLPVEDVEFFYQVAVEAMSQVPIGERALLYSGRMNPKLAVTSDRELFKWLSARNPSVMRRLYAVMQKAVDAEVNDYPPVVELTPQEREIAERLIQIAMKKRLSKMPPEAQRAIIEASVDQAHASPADYCALVEFVADCVFDIDGVGREWVLRMLLG